jgi:tetraacyldisaccharide-1-P 4'-kinase
VASAARRLERGSFDGPVGRGAERIWQAISATRVARPLVLPPGVRTIAIGGATLGGSGKTPLSILCAELASRAGAKVALVGHAFRASPERARIVLPEDDVACVGDEALVCARRLFAVATVVVGPTRQSAIDHAAACGAEVIVLDGVSQASPRRVDLALLALQIPNPWGAGACPPRGDLRAPRSALLGACDRSVGIGDAPDCDVFMKSRGAWDGTRYVDYDELSALRLGLVTSLARPGRVSAWLGRRGVVPEVVLSGGDHRAVSTRAMREAGKGLDAWVATEKCLTNLPGSAGLPVFTLDYKAFATPSFARELATALTRQTSGHRLEQSEFLPCALGTEPRPWGP